MNIDGVGTASLHSESCYHLAGTQRIALTYARYMSVPNTMYDVFYVEYDFGN